MSRTTKTFSVSLSLVLADALERAARNNGLSPSLKITEIVETHFLDSGASDLAEEAKADLRLLRLLRDEAIDKLVAICEEEGFSEDITLKTFQVCQNDASWLSNYEKYIRGGALDSGNPRKTNANQTIGSRIKSKLGADDLTDSTGKIQRGRAPAGSVIQTYQLLRLP
jgi:predicted DNA-binding protein